MQKWFLMYSVRRRIACHIANFLGGKYGNFFSFLALF